MKFFVYGTLKRAFGNHRILRDGKAAYLGRAVTLEPYVMVDVGFPFVWPHVNGWPVVGELFDIGIPEFQPAATTLYHLDRLESNGRMYQRYKRSVRILENGNGIMPLPRDAGEVHRDVWIYEALLRERPEPHDGVVLECLGDDTRLEWQRERSRQRISSATRTTSRDVA